MKHSLLPLAALFTLAPALIAAPADKPMKKVEPPPPLAIGAPQPASVQVYTYNQQAVATQPTLIAPEQARAVIDNFRETYSKLNRPRILIYVNRDLVDEQSGLRLAGRTETRNLSRGNLKSNYPQGVDGAGNRTDIKAGGDVTVLGDLNRGLGTLPAGDGGANYDTEKVSRKDTLKMQDPQAASLNDRQTVRDLERLFGRPLRHAGVILADQRIATQLLAGKPLPKYTLPAEGDQARKDREALNRVADVALEILVSSRQIVVQEVSGPKTYSVPDILATAIRLEDSRILGQASASDILGRDRDAGRIVSNFDVRDIAEATALALMEDMTLAVPKDE